MLPVRHITRTGQKSILLALVCCVSLAPLRAQDTLFPDGGYKNLKELNRHLPSSHDAFEIVQRSSENIRQHGGSDYVIYCNGSLKTMRKVWRTYLVIARNDTLYLNCKKLDIGLGFTPVLLKGRYLVFSAAMTPVKSSRKEEAVDGILYRNAPLSDKPNTAKFPFLWALDIVSGETTLLTYGGMIKVLDAFADLKAAYVQDENKDKNEVMMEYLRKVNNRSIGK